MQCSNLHNMHKHMSLHVNVHVMERFYHKAEYLHVIILTTFQILGAQLNCRVPQELVPSSLYHPTHLIESYSGL